MYHRRPMRPDALPHAALAPVALLALASCASSPSPRPAAPEPAPAAAAATPAAATNETPAQVVARLLSPEATAPLAPQQIEVDANLHVVGHGTAAATVRRDGEQFEVVLPVGGTEPVRCIVFNHSLDLANGARGVYERVRQENSNLEIRGIDAGFVGETPFLHVEALYVVGPAERRALGHLKLRVFNLHDRGFVCMHDEPGYVATFDRATRPLMEAPATTPSPYRYLLSLDGHTCGWMIARTGPTEGETTDLTISSFLIARSAQEMAASDDVEVERYNRAGEISEERVVKNEDGTESNYRVRRTAATHRYHVEGRHLGRDIAGDFTAATPLLSGTVATQRAYRALTGPRPPASFQALHYATDSPLAASTDTFRLERVVDNRRAWLTQRVGEMQARVLVGTEGIADEIAVDLAGRTLSFRRVTE